MGLLNFPDGNIADLVDSRCVGARQDVNRRLQLHSSLIRRLSLERELEGHLGCVNALAWNSSGSLLISGSDDTRINIWHYPSTRLLHSVETGHTANIFCTKFIPETSDELVVSGAGDAEVRLFHLSRLSERPENAPEPSAVFHCHTRRVKKLAVEAGNPNLVWSASEDGTLRQHDFRESFSCPHAGSSNQECRNVLLDLRCGAKRSLVDSPKQRLGLKSCEISATQPHRLLVGGSDAFGRLYDRRMLPSLTSSQKRMRPPPCVNYFCPTHLSDRGQSGLHLTHVTFSPNGEEVLLSYSGEHVYLMDVNVGGGNSTRYKSSNYMNQMNMSYISNQKERSSISLSTSTNGVPHSTNTPKKVLKYFELVQEAKKSFDESNCLYGIEACNEVLDGRGPDIGLSLKHECLCTRALLFLKRKWKNDAHMAIRDCKKALSIDPTSFRANLCTAEALLQLWKLKEALEHALAAHNLCPSSSEAFEKVESIKEQLSAAEAEKNNNNGTPKSDTRPGRVRSLSDIFHRSNSDASQDGLRLEREDSDYEEEMELDFETSISGDEERDIESGILRGCLNLRFRRRNESTKDKSSTNGSCGTSSQTESVCQPESNIDMKQRYIGHCNVGTDIKQASFLGQRGEYVASGSDDGRWFIWEKRTGRLIKMLAGDEAVVNCVQCHPFDCSIATSGIDSTIKIWTPCAHVPSVVAGGAAGPDTADVFSVMESNQQKLCEDRATFLPFELLERFRMHDFVEGTLHPFECAQS